MCDGELDRRAQAVFSTVGMARFLGMTLKNVQPESCEIEMTVDERHGNYVEGLHGGAAAAILDTCVFFAGDLLPSGRKLATEGIEVHLFRPVPMGEKVTAKAKIIKNGRKVVTVEGTLWTADNKQVAHSVATLFDVGAV